jgi:hypothetical protein
MEGYVDEVTTKQEIQFVGVKIQDFIIEKNLTRKKEWEEIVEELERYVALEQWYQTPVPWGPQGPTDDFLWPHRFDC